MNCEVSDNDQSLRWMEISRDSSRADIWSFEISPFMLTTSNKVDVATGVATACTGMMAGVACYVGWVQLPSRVVEDDSMQDLVEFNLVEWIPCYKKTGKFQVSLFTLSTLIGDVGKANASGILDFMFGIMDD